MTPLLDDTRGDELTQVTFVDVVVDALVGAQLRPCIQFKVQLSSTTDGEHSTNPRTII